MSSAAWRDPLSAWRCLFFVWMGPSSWMGSLLLWNDCPSEGPFYVTGLFVDLEAPLSHLGTLSTWWHFVMRESIIDWEGLLSTPEGPLCVLNGSISAWKCPLLVWIIILSSEHVIQMVNYWSVYKKKANQNDQNMKLIRDHWSRMTSYDLITFDLTSSVLNLDTKSVKNPALPKSGSIWESWRQIAWKQSYWLFGGFQVIDKTSILT